MEDVPAGTDAGTDAVRRWAASGCMHLSGPAASGGWGPPAGLVPFLDDLASRITSASATTGDRVVVDPLAVLAHRAALRGWRRNGRASCGGATRLLATLDGWVALSLARVDDLDLLPALTDGAVVTDPADGGSTWHAVAEWCARQRAGALVERAVLLGLAAAQLGEHGPGAPTGVVAERLGEAPPRAARDTVVVDLSSLWAGPLCGMVLRSAGCTVVKVEASGRPDASRTGDPHFFDHLHAGSSSVALDLATDDGRGRLIDLLRRADVVIESSRPRAMRQFGVDPHGLVAAGPAVWISITGHGYHGQGADRVGFGDDAAVAAGLVVGPPDDPSFCADAVADPLTGLAAAAHVLEALATGGRWHFDAALAAVAAGATGPTRPVPVGTVAAVPRPPTIAGRARPLGADTDREIERLLDRRAIR